MCKHSAPRLPLISRTVVRTAQEVGNVKEITLESSITQDIYVETHNDWKVFILRQSTIGNAQRPAVENSIVMTQDQLAKLVAAQQRVEWTAIQPARIEEFVRDLKKNLESDDE